MTPELEDLASAYVLDELDGRERAAFEDAVRRDPALAALVHDLELGLARGVRSLPPVAPHPVVLARIEQAIGPSIRTSRGGKPVAGLAPWWTWLAAGLAAAVGLAVGFAALRSMQPARAGVPVVVAHLGRDGGAFQEMRLPAAASEGDARFVQLARLAEDFWAGPPVAGAGATSPRSGRAYAVFDPASQQGFIGVQELPTLPPGKRYHLWIVDAQTGAVRDAGSLPGTEPTRGLFFFSLEPDAGSSRKPASRYGFLVTEEDASDQRQTRPQGRVVLRDARI